MTLPRFSPENDPGPDFSALIDKYGMPAISSQGIIENLPTEPLALQLNTTMELYLREIGGLPAVIILVFELLKKFSNLIHILGSLFQELPDLLLKWLSFSNFNWNITRK